MTHDPSLSSLTAATAAAGSLSVRFWGVRGSLACAGRQTVRYGGNTSCIEIACDTTRLIVDSGTGIRDLGADLARQGPQDLDMFLTHTHFDHIGGLPFFAPAYDPRNHVRVWAGHLGPEHTLLDVISQMMAAPLFPVGPAVFKADCSFNDFACGSVLTPRPGITVRTGPLNHPNKACGYRFDFAGRSVAVITDTEHVIGRVDESVMALARGADIMIYDGMYTDEEFPGRIGWGHSTWQEACRVADAAGVGRTVIFHHDPARTDDDLDRIAAAAEAMRPGTLVAHEGLILKT